MSSQTLAADPPTLTRRRRALPEDVRAYAEQLLVGPWFEVRITAEVDAVQPLLAARLADQGLTGGVPHAAFVADVAQQAALVASTAGTSLVEVRVEHDPGGRCPVFHEDHHVLRLMCTYAGPGTEWLPEAGVDRTQLGLQGRTPAEANRAIARAQPVRAEPGEVLLTRGTLGSPDGSGFVHRSPSRRLGSRLFVAIDPVAAALTPGWTAPRG